MNGHTHKTHAGLKDSTHVTSEQAKQKRVEKHKQTAKKRKEALLNKRRKADSGGNSNTELFDTFVDQPNKLSELVQHLDVRVI
jgi:nucleosome binding factor SPN SPT16 subunit